MTTIPLIRPYRDTDEPAILSLWEEALPFDSIGQTEFRRRVLLDANREPDSLQLAFDPAAPAGPPIGLILALVLRVPIEKTGLLEHRGFITAFGVRPSARRSGAGAALLARAEEFFRARNRREIALAPYTPNYFVPGVDKDRYAEGLAFLTKRGFTEFSEAIAMDATIGTFSLDEKTLATEAKLRTEGIVIEPIGGAITEFLEFLAAIMPGPWVEDGRRVLTDRERGTAPDDCVYLARDHGKIIGYCQYEGEHFGPFGVSDGYQGRGIGSVLLARTILAMRRNGTHNAFVLWTGERAANGVYGRLGFTRSRRFALLRKTL